MAWLAEKPVIEAALKKPEQMDAFKRPQPNLNGAAAGLE
jgi:hypothetical protein